MIQFCLNKLKKTLINFGYYLEVDSGLSLYSYKPEIAINSLLIGKS